MNLFIKIVLSFLLIFAINSCGSDTKILKDIPNTKAPQTENKKPTQDNNTNQEKQNNQNQQNQNQDNNQNSQNQSQQEEQEDNNNYDNDEFVSDSDSNSIYIIDSSLSYAPNVDLYDNDPSGAYYKYSYNNQREQYTLKLHSNGLKNSFHILGYDVQRRYQWNSLPSYQNKLYVSWDAKFSNDFIIFIVLKFKTSDGEIFWRDLVYTPTKYGYDGYTNDFLHISLGKKAKNGSWRHYERNVLSDLRKFYPGATIDYSDEKSGYINGFAVRGSGEITNIKLSNHND